MSAASTTYWGSRGARPAAEPDCHSTKLPVDVSTSLGDPGGRSAHWGVASPTMSPPAATVAVSASPCVPLRMLWAAVSLARSVACRFVWASMLFLPVIDLRTLSSHHQWSAAAVRREPRHVPGY